MCVLQSENLGFLCWIESDLNYWCLCRAPGINICFPWEFVPTRDSEQVRTRLRVNKLGWMQKSQEPFQERARKRPEGERGGGGERHEGRAEMTSAVLLMTWSGMRRETRERRGRQTEQEGGLRKQLVRMIQRSVGGGEEVEGSRRRGGARDWWGRVRN